MKKHGSLNLLDHSFVGPFDLPVKLHVSGEWRSLVKGCICYNFLMLHMLHKYLWAAVNLTILSPRGDQYKRTCQRTFFFNCLISVTFTDSWLSFGEKDDCQHQKQLNVKPYNHLKCTQFAPKLCERNPVSRGSFVLAHSAQKKNFLTQCYKALLEWTVTFLSLVFLWQEDLAILLKRLKDDQSCNHLCILPSVPCIGVFLRWLTTTFPRLSARYVIVLVARAKLRK